MTTARHSGGEGNRTRWGLAVTALLLVVLLSGCVVRVVYNQLDWLVLWYVEDYVDLDPAQERQAKELIAQTLEWHRSTQLPHYATLSRAVLAGVGTAGGPQFVADRFADIVELSDELLRRVGPGVAALLQTLSDEQVDALFAKLDENNRELAEDYSGLSRDERRVKRDKAIIRAFHRFTGRLTEAQLALIRSRSTEMHNLSAEWLQRRAVWQQEFRLLVLGRKSEPQFASRFTDLVLNPNQFDSPRYRRLVLDNQQRSFKLVADVLRALSPAQEGRVRKRLTTYAGDFEALVRERVVRRGAEERT